MSSSDRSRKKLESMLRENGIYQGSTTYTEFSKFLKDPLNTPYLQMYYLLLSGYFDCKEVVLRTRELLGELFFVLSGDYSYRSLFSKDAGWYDYFKENAWPSGQLRDGDIRRGVNRDQIDGIMCVKCGPPEVDLETAISRYYMSKYERYMN